MLGAVAVVVLLIVGYVLLSSVVTTAMSVFGIVFTLLTWMFAGYLAGRLLRGRGYGVVGNIALGLAGGIVGSIILRVIGLGAVGNVWLIGGILVGVIGAVILVFLVRLFANEDFAR